MLSRVRLLTKNRYATSCRFLSDKNSENSSGNENPLDRTFRLLGNDMKKVKRFFTPRIETNITSNKPDSRGFKGDKKTNSSYDAFQTHCDVLVIGGGGIGSSIAYWLKQRARDGLNVVVLEKDNTVIINFLIFRFNQRTK